MKICLFTLLLFTSLSAVSQKADTTLHTEYPFVGNGVYYSTRFTNFQFVGTLSTPIIQAYKISAIYQKSDPKIIGRLFLSKINQKPFNLSSQSGLIWKYYRGGKYTKTTDYNSFNGGIKIAMKDSIYLEGSANFTFQPIDTMFIEGYILFEGLTERYPFSLTLVPNYNSFEDLSSTFKSPLEPRGIRIDNYQSDSQAGTLNKLKSFTNLESLWLNGIPNKPLPSFIFSGLPHLKGIQVTHSSGSGWISGNEKPVSYPFPMKLFRIPSLKMISFQSIQNLQLSDSIPIQNELEILELVNCDLTLLPPSFYNLVHLKELKLFPALSTPPANLNKFTKLEKLFFQIGKDDVVPEGFGPWPNLQELILDTWNLTPDPAFIARLIADHPNATIQVNGKKVN